jgi:hypothetical protein
MYGESTYHVLVGVTSLVEREDGLVYDGVDVVGLDGRDHVLHQSLGADKDATGSADVDKSIHQGVLGGRSSQEPNDADDSLISDGRQTLLYCTLSSDLDDVVDTLAVVRESASGLAPVRVLPVVNNMVGAELLEGLALLLGRCSRNDGCTSSLGELRRTNVSRQLSSAYGNGLPTCNAKMLTPPVPWTSTTSPALMGLRPYRAFQLVKAAQVKVEASMWLRFLGARTRPFSLKTPY